MESCGRDTVKKTTGREEGGTAAKQKLSNDNSKENNNKNTAALERHIHRPDVYRGRFVQKLREHKKREHTF